jgi:predicted lysophospholipase L1 biosynthesis ABC-type transport system permease subunit
VTARGSVPQCDGQRRTQLADVVILVSLPIAGCSLAVAVAAGLSERKRPFSVLRLTGVPVAMLRRVVALETVVPLFLAATVSIAVGFLAAQLFRHAQLDQTLVTPVRRRRASIDAAVRRKLGVSSERDRLWRPG